MIRDATIDDAAGVVYFLQAEHGGAVKIGAAQNLARARGRLADCQTGSAHTLVQTRVVVGVSERSLHDRFAHLRIRGEWFAPDDELVRLAHCKPIGKEPRLRRRPTISCAVCGSDADSIHLLPAIMADMRVEFACPKHDLGGYWFELSRWTKSEDHPGMRAHLIESKEHGRYACELIDDALRENLRQAQPA